MLSYPCDASVLLTKCMWSWSPEFASWRSKKDRFLQQGHCNTLMEVFCNASYRHSLCCQWTSRRLGKARILVQRCENTFVFLATSALSRWTIVSLCVIPFSSYDNFFFILFSLICFLKRFNCDIVATTRRWQMYTLFLSLNVTCEAPRSMMVYGSNRPWLYIFFPNKKCSLLAYHCHRAFS